VDALVAGRSASARAAECSGGERRDQHARRAHSCGSKILENYVPPYDATAVERLGSGWRPSSGKTNCDENLPWQLHENSAYGPVRNPRLRDRVPGGSRGGSAAAVGGGG